ncbi:TldD/PmbA family protein [bacterium]|jgi:PmbA protein|nr:TldD/PmbA family protein [bacterium]
MHSNLKGQPALLHAVRKLEKLNLDQFEVYLQRKNSLKIESKNQQIDSLTRAEDVGLSIRVIQDKRKGFSFTTSLEKAAIENAVDSAVEVAQYVQPDEFNELFQLSSSVYPEVDSFDAKGVAVPLEQKIALAKQLETACKSADKRITGVRSAALGETLYEVHMLDSGGDLVQYKTTLFTAGITCKAEEGGDSQMGDEFAFSNYLDNLQIAQTGKLAAQWATELLGAKPVATMQCPAVFRNSVVAGLLDFLSSSFSAENIDKGRSMLAKKQGQRIFSENITIVDDGLLPGGIATSPFDAEGVPSAKTVLIENGFLMNSLYDTYYAKKMGTEPTGNSSRGIKAPPSISTTNIYLQQGRKNPEQLLEGLKKSILITDLMGIHTANPVTGDFSLGASGILIEKGKPVGPIRGFAVAGNVLDLFLNTSEVGNDLRFFGNVGAPSILVGKISVSGA